MNKSKVKFMMLPFVALVIMSFDTASDWMKLGSHPHKYDMGIDKGSGRDGKNAASIKSKAKKIYGFGTLMQVCKPTKYLGKRIRMSGFVKSNDVKDWAGLWLRIDEDLGFDNMHERPIKGNTEWTKYEIVLDVPLTTTNLAYGALLHGTGQIWFDDLTFEIVDDSVPLTSSPGDRGVTLEEPTNLDFEK